MTRRFFLKAAAAILPLFPSFLFGKRKETEPFCQPYTKPMEDLDWEVVQTYRGGEYELDPAYKARFLKGVKMPEGMDAQKMADMLTEEPKE